MQSLTEAARVTLAQQQRQRALNENALALLLGQPLPPELRAPACQAAAWFKYQHGRPTGRFAL